MIHPASHDGAPGAMAPGENESGLLRRYFDEKSDAAFGAFVRQTIDFVYSAALRRIGGDAHAAADVTQQVYIAAAQNARSLARHPNVSAWLHTATRNAATNLMRDQNLRLRREREAQATVAVLTAPAHDAEWARLRPVIDAALDELGERDREAVLLRIFQDRSFGEIGARLQISENGARMRVERALEKLQALLAKRGITSTTAALLIAVANGATVSAPAGLAVKVTGAAIAAGSATFSAFTLFQFMSTTKFLGGAAAVLAAMALGTIGWQVRAQQQSQDALATASRDYDAGVAKWREVERRVRAGEARVGELQGEIAAADANPAPGAASRPAPRNPVAEGKAFMARHPEVTQAYLDLSDSSALYRYYGFMKSRGLGAAEIEQFKFLARSLNLGPMNVAIGSDGRRAPLQAEGILSEEDADRQLRNLLGQEGYTAYKEFNQTKPARDSAHMTAVALCFTATPLTPELGAAMTRIISEHSPRSGNPYIADWDVIDAAVKAVLLPPQRAAWDAVLALNRARGESARTSQAARTTAAKN